MDSKIVKADRKAVKEAVVAAAGKVATAYMDKYYDRVDENVRFLTEAKHECERRHAEKCLRSVDAGDILEDLFSSDNSAYIPECVFSGIDAVLNGVTDTEDSKGPKVPKDLSAAVKDVKWEDLTDEGKRLFVDDLSKSFADNAAEMFAKRLQDYADYYHGYTLSDINDEVLDSIHEDNDLEGTEIDEDHAFVLKHLKPKRKADEAAESTAKRARA